MSKNLYRLLDASGPSSEIWRGKAYDVDHALDRAFTNEDPDNIEYTLEMFVAGYETKTQIHPEHWEEVFKGKLT